MKWDSERHTRGKTGKCGSYIGGNLPKVQSRYRSHRILPGPPKVENIPSVRDPKWWNLSIFREQTLGPHLVMHASFLPESWIFPFCEEYP